MADALDLLVALEMEIPEALENTRERPTYRPGIGKKRVSGLIIPFKKANIRMDVNMADKVMPSLI